MLFEFIRKLTCNFEEIEKHVPKEGFILDIGCGHGIFSKILSEKSPGRRVLGIDPSEEKIKIAKRNYSDTQNIYFRNCYLEDLKDKFDVAVVVDIIYLLPPVQKEMFLKAVKKILKKNGKLILVINGTKPASIHKILLLQEWVMHYVFKITYSDYGKTYFESKEETIELLEKAGYDIEKIVNIKSTLPYPHILFVAKI